MTSRSVLVTGGAGFVGSHTCKALAAHGLHPITLDNLSRGNRTAVRWGSLIEGDILDSWRLEKVLKEYAPTAIIHFAALAYVGESVEKPAEYYRNNVAGTLSLLEACRNAGTRQFIFSSSCATYGIPTRLPISEDHPQVPINPYGHTKLICEQMIRDFAAAYGMRFVLLRYFNACGADPEGQIGEWHSPETHLIPRALMAVKSMIPSLAVFGDDYNTPDGTCLRDYIHVSDLARAHVLALKYLAAGNGSVAVNLGSGQCFSVKDILASIQKITGTEVPITIEPRRPGDPPVLYADASLARRLFGFSTELSDLDTIIGTAEPLLMRKDASRNDSPFQ